MLSYDSDQHTGSMGDEKVQWNVHATDVPSPGPPDVWELLEGATQHSDRLDMQDFLLVKKCNEIGIQIHLKKRQLKELRKQHRELIAKSSFVVSDSELLSESV